ncbi:MAG: GxxExxY protein [Bacteroidales bacterium]|nr:GxxExxY protein [Bacteroidales bacterium]
MLNFDTKIYLVVGASFQVLNELRNGLLEPIYQEALKIEFDRWKIPNEREVNLPIFYRGIELSKSYRVDFLCFNDVIVELKSTETLLPEHRLQLFNYMRITRIKHGILLNFGTKHLQSEYYELDEESNECWTYKFNVERVPIEFQHYKPNQSI